jgi:hypothetical protein
MATLFSRRAMKRADPNPHGLTWADIQRPQPPRPPSGLALALFMAGAIGFAAGVALVLMATGAA